MEKDEAKRLLKRVLSGKFKMSKAMDGHAPTAGGYAVLAALNLVCAAQREIGNHVEFVVKPGLVDENGQPEEATESMVVVGE